MRRIHTLTLIGLAWLILTGCISQRTTTILREDASGTNTIQIGFSRQVLAFVGMGGGQGGADPIDEMFTGIEDLVDGLPAEWKATSQPWESEDKQFEGTSISMEFRDLAMLNAQFSSDAMAGSPVAELFKEFAARQEGDTLIIEASLEPGSSENVTGAQAEQAQQMMDSGMFGDSEPEVIWRIEMPGKITEWTEQEFGVLEGNTVTYSLPLSSSQSYDIRVKAQVGRALSPGLMLAIGGLLTVGVLTIGYGLWLNRRNRRALAPVSPVAPSWNAQPAPPGYQPPAPLSYQPPPQQRQQSAPPPAAPAPSPAPSEWGSSSVLPTKPLGSFWDENQDQQRD